MAWVFADGFDLYAATADALGYWDTGTTTTNLTLVAGRFTGSQAIRIVTASSHSLVKTSSVNDAVHHLACAFYQSTAIGGTTLGMCLQLLDGTTNQCCIVFRSDGAILLTSGGPTGTVLATYTGAFPVVSTWYHFEIEVVINNTTGSFKVRKNGNSTEDFSLGSLNTRGGTANNYANQLKLIMQASVQHQVDDLFWQSSAAAGTWLGDIRCYTRMPASDASVTWSRTPSGAYPLFPQNSTNNFATSQARYAPFTIGNNGTLGTVTLAITTASTANLKCTLFSDNAGTPGTVLGSATPVGAPGIGAATFTFGTPVSVTAGTKYWAGIIPDAASGAFGIGSGTAGFSGTGVTYASFPASNPVVGAGLAPSCVGIGVTPAVNWPYVAEAQQDATTSYVYSSTVNDADLYGIAAIASTPATVIATTIRAYMQKSDAGTRTAAVQVKSGSTTVASSTLTLTTSGWQWAWRMDLVDPATGTAWTAAAVNAATIGPKVIA